MKTPGTTTDIEPRPHSGDDLDSALIVRLAVIFVLGIAFAILVVALLFRVFEHVHPDRGSEAAPLVTAADLPPQPRLQMTPLRDLEAVRAAEDRHLTRYAWIDRTKGTAQIPIDRAIILWVQTYTLWAQTHGPAATNAGPATAKPPPTLAPDSVPAPAMTNSPPVTGPTELQMRQDKAKEAPHAP